MIIGKTIDEIKVGDKDFTEKTITETDVYLYAGITGDFNPAHINQVYAEGTMFKGRIAHGMLTAGLISQILGMKLPGPGTIYLSQELKFQRPVRMGDTIHAEVEVEEVIKDKNRVILKTTCKNQNDEIVLDGKAVVLAPKN